MAETLIHERGREQSLSSRLRESTRAEHSDAEHSSFMADLVEGRLNLSAWAALLEQLQPVYAALRDGSEQLSSHPQLGPLFSPALHRTPQIASDLRRLRELTGEPPRGVGTAATAYAEQIRRSVAQPECFVAHHYTRYLGDLSGGRIMAVRFRQHYGLPDDAATFFDFPGIPAAPIFKRAYRATLDAWNPDAGAAERLIAETRESFRANEAIFAELDARRRSETASRVDKQG